MTNAQPIEKQKEDRKDIPFGRPWIEEEDRQAVLNVLQGHILTHGPACHKFEEDFAAFTQGGYAVTTSSCMASLHLSTLHFGLGPGDEVLVPAQTHVATVHAVEITGATPVFVDCELETGNMDIAILESKITPRTKAVVIVHFAGIPAQMDRICAIADKHGMAVIEDCALAVGGLYKGKHVGLWGDTGCFSFYPVKHLTTGEGGMLISKNEETASKIRNFRAFNYDRDQNERKIPGLYDVAGVGLNYRMSEMQAALGCVQITKLDKIRNRRKENFTALKTGLLGIKEIRHVLDSADPDCTNSHYCVVAILDEPIASRRNDIILALTDRKVGCSIYYPQPVPRTKYYAERYKSDPADYKNASIISDSSIALPVGPHLDVADMGIIVKTLKETIESL